MATTIDWATGIITVNQADLTLVSGTLYTMDTDAFRLELKALEASLAGMAEPDIHLHNTAVTVGGITYARTIEILSPYSVQFLPNTQWSVRLEGSNNNIWDVEAGILVQNQVQVIPTNSGGLIDGTITSQIVEGTLDVQAALRVILAATAGKLSGAATTTVTIRNTLDDKNRIVATVDADGNRTAIVLDTT